MDMDTINRTIEWTRKREGDIYGEGTAALMTAIRDELASSDVVMKIENVAWTPAHARRMITKVLRKFARNSGCDPERGIASRPASTKGYVGEGFEYVGWESGPYQWAIQTATVVNEITGLLAEPYYSFDLCISER